MAKKDAITITTQGWDALAVEMLALPDPIEQKYALAATREVALQLKNEQKARIRRSGVTGGANPIWGKAAWKALKIRKISASAKRKHGSVGYRAGFVGPGSRGWAARGAWLERGKRNKDGTMSRAYPFIQPSRDAVEPRIPEIMRKGVSKGLQKEAKRIARKVAASKAK